MLALLMLLAAARARVGRSAKITLSIHWTVPSNFYFLANPQIMHCLKDIMGTRTFTHVMCASEHVGCSDFFWCINNTLTVIVPIFVKIR